MSAEKSPQDNWFGHRPGDAGSRKARPAYGDPFSQFNPGIDRILPHPEGQINVRPGVEFDDEVMLDLSQIDTLHDALQQVAIRIKNEEVRSLALRLLVRDDLQKQKALEADEIERRIGLIRAYVEKAGGTWYTPKAGTFSPLTE